MATPQTLEVNGARVHVQRHTLPAGGDVIPCWTYISEGLAALGQQELVFTLRRAEHESPEAFPPHPVHFVEAVAGFARAQKWVGAGEYTELGASGFLGRADFRGIGYLPLLPLPGVTLPPKGLTALVLTHDELTLVKQLGLSRVVARLGEAYGYFPTPPWGDRARASVVVAGDMQESLLLQVPRLGVQGARVRKEGNGIVLTLPRAALEPLRLQLGQIPLDLTPCILCLPDEAAGAALVWRPGQQQPKAYAAPGADGCTISGSHCLFVPQQNSDGGQLMEDGFAIMLADPSWAQLRQAMLNGQPAQMQPDDANALSLQISWR